ncbi:MAG: hypothetical protein JF623_00075 [Acidobacteria bacterium]|nr:hypothetical protein [Acidobacteriota bacterium]
MRYGSSWGGWGITSACKPVRLAERDPVEPLDRPPRRALLGALAELAELGAVELVRLPKLMQEPDDLVRVTDRVRRKLRRDHDVDRSPVRFVEVEQPPEECLAEDALAWIPLVRNRDEVDLVPAHAQLRHEVVGEDLRAAALERHLRRADRDPHGALSSCTRVFTREPTSLPVAAEANEEERTGV